MKYLRKYNESNSDDKIVEDYIKSINSYEVKGLSRTPNETTYLIDNKIKVSHSLADLYKGIVSYNVKLNDIELNASEDIIKELFGLAKLIAKQQINNNRLKLVLCRFLVKYLQESSKKIDDRLEEFGVIDDNFRNNVELDMLSLNSLFDFYEVEFAESIKDSIRKLALVSTKGVKKTKLKIKE